MWWKGRGSERGDVVSPPTYDPLIVGAVSVDDAVVFGKDLMNKHVVGFPGLTIGSN